MRHSRGILTLAALVALWVSPLRAATSYMGVTMPDTVVVDGQTLVLNGIGLRTLTIFRVGVYVAALYLPSQSHDAQAIESAPGDKELQLHFLHAASKSDVQKQYREGERVNCGDGNCDKSDEPDYDILIANAPVLAVGDTLTYQFTTTGVRVLVNAKVTNNIANKDLSLRVLAGFIGEHPPSPELKRQLLGLPAN